MKLYGMAMSPFVQRVKMQMVAKGIDFELAAPVGGGIKSDEFLALNPMGKMPCLQTENGLALPESEVILEYIEDAFPKPPLRPKKADERAQVRLISRVTDLYLVPTLGKLFAQIGPAKDAAATAAVLEEINKALGHLEVYASGKKHIAGNKFTIADCSLTPILFYITRITPLLGVKVILRPYKKLAKYWKSRDKDAVSAQAIEEMATAMKARFGI
jgi:glutathione S-transferase